jgi:glycosyltransferase involved in cell wall biosynthesis
MTARLATIAPSVDLETLVRDIAGSEGILRPLRAMGRLSELAAGSAYREAYALLAPLAHNYKEDPLAAYLAVHALAGVGHRDVDDLYCRLLAVDDPGLSQHVAWAFSRRRPMVKALPHLEAMIGRGGFDRMVAELAMETWLREVPEIGWRLDRELARRLTDIGSSAQTSPKPFRGNGLRIAQVLMQGRVDADLTAAASGDGGGLITLQVGLARELADHDSVDDVYLITRAIDDGTARFTERTQPLGDGTLARLTFGPPGYLTTVDLWPHRLELEKELRRFLTEEGPFDAIHLRFADVGTFVAARVAGELGIPVFFTLAPDPHAVIAAAEASGEINRANFAEVDAEEHFVFRAWLVEWLLTTSHRLALLPRPDQQEQFRRLFDIDVERERFKVIPEGIDFRHARQARNVMEGLAPAETPPRVIADIEEAIAAMPVERKDLPLLLTVGRLHPIKGMERVVAAWARDPVISDAFNLVVVGGNLDEPSATESGTLAEIARSLQGDGQKGLIMLGGRTHGDVALIMAAAVSGTTGGIGPHGVYVCGSGKEEFGLAIVEAMAAGLPVVAPRDGGPATYVEHGFTGYLADTKDLQDIRDGIRWADRVRASDLRADSARKKIETRYSLSAMADGLVELYRTAMAELTAS